MLGNAGWRYFYVVTVLLLICAVAAHADTWQRVVWEDDFEDGDYTSDPAWTTFESPSGTHNVTSWEGDYAFEHTAPYYAAGGAGWSGAFVTDPEGDQGIEGWVDTSPVSSNDWAALYMLRYSAPTLGFGSGYALGLTHNAADEITAQLFELNDTGYAGITDYVTVSDTYEDLWVRFLATGTGSNIHLKARMWADGESEPSAWHLDSDNPGSAGGIINQYDSGCGGVGVVSLVGDLTADAYFDDVKYGTPEPGTLALIATGLGALVLRRRRDG